MQGLILALRAIHIVFGVFWAGTVLFLNTLLAPSLSAAGPAGGQVLYHLSRRGFHGVMAIASTLTVLSGATLLWLASAGLTLSWVESPVGAAFCAGGASALTAYLVGFLMVRPRVKRMERVQGDLEQATTDALRATHASLLGDLRGEVATWSRLTAILLIVAVGAMATARYI